MEVDHPVTSIDSWDVIRNQLCNELDADQSLFDEVLQRSRSQLGHVQQVTNAAGYFEILENNMEPNDVVDFTINLLELLNLHVDFGNERLADTLKHYKNKCQRYYQQLEETDVNFVGRLDYIKQIENNMNNENGKKGKTIQCTTSKLQTSS